MLWAEGTSGILRRSAFLEGLVKLQECGAAESLVGPL